MTMVQVWNIETNRAEEMHGVMLRQRTWKELEDGVRNTFRHLWTTENQSRFALYYIYDLSDPVLSRLKVESQEQLDAYFAFRADTRRDSHLHLYLHIAVIFQASGKPVSPLKPPLSINTALARAHDIGTTHSSSHLSPNSASSPQSPGTPREKEFRQVVLARDSEGCVRPDAAKLGPPACIYRCVFCHKLFLPGKKQIEAAHVIPHAPNERLGKEFDTPTLVAIGGSIDSLTNGVSVCSICHGSFDDGLMWVERVNSTSVMTVVVDASIRTVDQHAGPLHNTVLRTPTDARFPFPGEEAWQWRKEWAELRRQQQAASIARKLAELDLQGSPQLLCRCGRANINKKCRTGAGGTPSCKQCCREASKTCAAHGLVGDSSAANSSAPAASGSALP